MTRSSIGLAFLLASTVNFSHADEIPFPDIFSQNPIKRFQPKENSRFDLIDRELKNLIAFNGSSDIENFFCASGFSFPNESPLVIVIWKNEQQLYRWEGTLDPREREKSISLRLTLYSNLKTPVDDGAILSGPRTMNRSQVKSAIEDCEQYGQKFLIPPFTPEPEKSDDDFDEDDLEYIDDTQESGNTEAKSKSAELK